MESPAVTTSSACRNMKRLHMLDELRGVTVLSMIAFHAAYDLAYIYDIELPWFTSDPLQELWRVSISWTFLALAGWMTSLSRSNLRRGFIYAFWAFVIWLVTSCASVDEPISFGIMYCMAASTLLWSVLERAAPNALDRWCLPLSLMSIMFFLVLYEVPRTRYGFGGFAWIGLPDASFASSDYYPIIPFFFLYAASALTARRWKQQGRTYPIWMSYNPIPALAWVGRHALEIYIAHQPIILFALNLMFET